MRPIQNGRGAKPTLVLLVRHGQTATTGVTLPGRAPGLHLAEKGREEAADVAGRIAQLPRIAAVYASPLERAQETAAPIAAAVGLPVTVEPGLLECDYGEWTGLALKDLSRKPEWKVIQRYPSGFRFPGGESFVEMQARMADTLARLVGRPPRQHRGGDVSRGPDQDGRRARARHASRSLPAHRGLHGIGHGHCLRAVGADRSGRQRHPGRPRPLAGKWRQLLFIPHEGRSTALPPVGGAEAVWTRDNGPRR